MSIQQDISGIEAISDWIGDGAVPVSSVLAEFRATRCTKSDNGKPCPHNTAPGWWNTAKSAVADWIKKELEVKNGMRLFTSQDQELHMCDVCGCCPRLKVWTPLKHIKQHTPIETIKRFPAFCWQRIELENV